MSKLEIKPYFRELETKLIKESVKYPITLTDNWTNQFTSDAGVHVLWEEDEICYVGESKNLKKRIFDLHSSKNHAGRKNIGEQFSDNIEQKIHDWLESKMTISVLPISIGRIEFKEYIIKKYNPRYNKRPRAVYKTANKRQSEYVNAYKPWSIENDKKLKELYLRNKALEELMEIFKRNKGAIEKRIKKLGLK